MLAVVASRREAEVAAVSTHACQPGGAAEAALLSEAVLRCHDALHAVRPQHERTTVVAKAFLAAGTLIVRRIR